MFKKSSTLLACLILIPCSLSSAQSGTSDYGSGVHQYFSGRHQTAINTLSGAIAADSKNSRAYYFRGLAKMGAGDSYGAKSDFEMGALIEASSSKMRTSLVTRSLERVQGGLRLEIEKTRKRAFARGTTSTVGSSTVMASSIPSLPVQSYPVQSYPVQSLPVVSSCSEIIPPVPSPVYSATIVPALPVYSTPIVYQQPQIISSEPIQPQTFIGGQVVGDSPNTFSSPVYEPAIVVPPAPAESVFESDSPTIGLVSETPSEELEMVSPTTPEPDPEPIVETAIAEEPEAVVVDVDVDAFAAAADEPEIIETFDEEPMASEESSVEAEMADEGTEEPVAAEEVEMPAEFGAATSEPADAEVVFGAEASEPVEMPVETEGGSDPFGAALTESNDGPFGASDSAPTEDPFGAGAAEAEPTNDPFGAGGEEPEIVDDPFGV